MKAGLFVTLALAATSARALGTPASSDTIAGGNGSIKVTAIFHASVQLDYHGIVIVVDPISAGSFRKKADLVLITHTHPDHLDVAAIRRVIHNPADGATTVVGPAAAKEVLAKLSGATLVSMSNGSSMNFATRHGAVTAEAVPAYNIVRGPTPGQYFHPKGQFNGYIVTLGGTRLYFAGDTEAIPEMKNLKHITAAFLPMNLPYTMTPQEAARAARSFHPRMAYPYHYRYPFDKANTNPQQFATALKGSGITPRFLEFYPEAAVKKAMAAMAAKK